MMAKPDILHGHSQSGTSVIIDGVTCFAPRRQLTGAELRRLPEPPVGADRDLWLDVDGDLDKMIEPGETVALRPQMRFFTVPKVINPGGPS
jgi:hypothetical protein